MEKAHQQLSVRNAALGRAQQVSERKTQSAVRGTVAHIVDVVVVIAGGGRGCRRRAVRAIRLQVEDALRVEVG